MMRAFYAVIILLVSLTLSHCTSKKEKPKMTVEAYKKQSVLLVGTLSKLMSETDIKKMNRMAVALQQSRAVTCFDINNECKFYGKMMSKIIQETKDHKLSTKELMELRSDFKELVAAIKSGVKVLEKQWADVSAK